MGAIIFSGGGGRKLSKFDATVFEILKDSEMELAVEAADSEGNPTWVTIRVKGGASRIPSTTNSRLNMFPKIGLTSLLRKIQDGPGARRKAEQAIALLKRTHVTSTINPEHKTRLQALTILYGRLSRKPSKFLKCDKDNRWLVTIHLHQDLHRVDTHNLTKPVCDWLQQIGLIQNDKHIDCFPVRNIDFAVPDNESLYISLRRLEDIRNEVSQLTMKMISR